MKGMVSIIMPTYNRGRLIKKAIDSVLRQTYTAWELIVVDDASTDNTENIISSYKDDRIIYLKNEKNVGANISRNIGIEKARGEYIAFLDSDNTWREEKLNIQMQKMTEGFDMVYSAFILHDGLIEISFPKINSLAEYDSKELSKVLSKGNVADTSTILIKNDFLHAIGKFDKEMPRLQDYDLAIKAVCNGKVGYINEELVDVYRTEVSITNNKSLLPVAIRLLLKKYPDFWKKNNCVFEKMKYGYDYCIKYGVERELLLKYIYDILRDFKEQFPEEVEQFKEYVFLKAIDIQDEKNTIIQSVEDDVQRRIAREKEFIIYGAGMKAIRYVEGLDDSTWEKLKYFLVSKKEDNQSMIKDKLVLDIPDARVQGEAKETLILVVTMPKYHGEIEMLLKEVGFGNYVFVYS